MTLEEFKIYCLAKPGVSESYPMKGEAVWMKANGKLFAIANVRDMKMEGVRVPPFHFINLKCDPERAVALRAQHPAIRPGWHQNKTHWNSVMVGEGIADNLLRDLIDHSYDLATGKK